MNKHQPSQLLCAGWLQTTTIAWNTLALHQLLINHSLALHQLVIHQLFIISRSLTMLVAIKNLWPRLVCPAYKHPHAPSITHVSLSGDQSPAIVLRWPQIVQILLNHLCTLFGSTTPWNPLKRQLPFPYKWFRLWTVPKRSIRIFGKNGQKYTTHFVM